MTVASAQIFAEYGKSGLGQISIELGCATDHLGPWAHVMDTTHPDIILCI
jgi:hypothetical protein